MKKLLFMMMATLGLSLSAYADCGKCEAKCDKAAKCEKSACEAKLKEVFAKFDADKDGKLSMEEFKALAMECKKKSCASKCSKSKCSKSKCSKSKCDSGKCSKSKCSDGKCGKKEGCTKCEGDCKCKK